MAPGRSEALLAGLSAEAKSSLAAKKVYFGHQSVGYDIVKGIEDLLDRDPTLGIRIIETGDPEALGAACFAHSKSGVNKQPWVKIEAFEKALDSGLGGRADIAFFKFCYVDFTPDTDLAKLFNDYKATMAGLRQRHPGTNLAHVTVPLTTVEAGPKAWAKRILRRPLAGVRENVIRSRFNDMLRAEYVGKEPIFDLASVESTYPDGSRRSFTRDGTSYPALIAGYSHDGRHLNEVGRQWVAAHLLKFLAELPTNAASPPIGSAHVLDVGGGGAPAAPRGARQEG
ncbi:MAG TPA: hypothetical protein VF139_07535 [Candidatus Polarisedimenticolaceae bacterium]